MTEQNKRHESGDNETAQEQAKDRVRSETEKAGQPTPAPGTAQGTGGKLNPPSSSNAGSGL